MNSGRPNLWFLGFAAAQFGFLIVGGLMFGNYLDKKYSCSPWLAITGLVAGFAGGIFLLLRIIKISNQQNKE